jgi:hypothetical protein
MGSGFFKMAAQSRNLNLREAFHTLADWFSYGMIKKIIILKASKLISLVPK